MQIEDWKSDEKVLIIAEIGNNHEGNIELAKEMIKSAAKCGVDAVKFQTFKTEYYISRKDKSRFDMIKSFELSYTEFQELRDYTKNLGLLFISTPLDIESSKFIGRIADAIKIASSDNDFIRLLEVSAGYNKPLIISSGLTNLKSILQTKKLIGDFLSTSKLIDRLGVLHCVTSYPVEPDFANLSVIPNLRKSLKCTIGYSDHTLGLEASISAVALGARIIEKHFTIDNNLSDFRDHQISADPVQMSQLVKSIRIVERMLGTGEKKIEKPEIPFLNLVRRSIVADKKLPKKHILSIEDLTWIRESGGLSPGEEKQLIGKKLKNGKNKFDLITISDLE